jgi:hypothetical protein
MGMLMICSLCCETVQKLSTRVASDSLQVDQPLMI